MNYRINRWFKIILIMVLIPILTSWDSLVGVLALGVGLVWAINRSNNGLPRIFFSVYLSGWLSWWLALPWWQTAGLILLLMVGQRLIKPGARHYQLISLSYLLGSVLIATLILGDWLLPIGVWSIWGWLTLILVMIGSWVWLKKSPITNSEVNWYVQ